MFKFKETRKYVINLPRRPDRLKEVMKEFHKHDIDITPWKAVDGQALEIKNMSSKADQYNAKGILGCLMSHIELIKFAKKEEMKYVVIFEDDVKLATDFEKRIKHIEENTPDFDMFYLGGHFSDMDVDVVPTNDKYIYKAKAIAGTYAYVLRNTLYNYILSNCNYNWGMDQFYVEIIQKHFKCYAFIPFLAGHIDGFSDVAMTNVDYKQTRKYYKDTL